MEKKIKKSKRGRPSKYEASFKRKIIQELYSGSITRSELCRKYQLGSNSTVLSFEKWYDDDQKQMLSSVPMILEEDVEGADKGQQPASSKGGLEQELRLAKLKIICLETLIDVAEESLHIEIRKKAGTKPS